MSESLANEEVNEHHENTSSHRVQPTAGIAIPENEEVIDVRELFRSPITLFRFFEPLYRRVAFPSSSPDADAAFVSLQNAIELHQRWEAACFLCIIYAFHRIDVDTARDLASFLMPWILILIGQSESRNPLRAVLTLAPEDRPYVHYVLGLMVLKDLGLSKGLPPTPESFHQGVHHLLEFSAQPFEYAPAFFQAAMALESSPMGDVPTAICLYARAVKAGGIPSACYRLATYYFDKKLREGYKSVVLQQVPDDEAALELLKTAAEKGHEGAQLEYVTRCLAKINLAPPILAMSFAPNAPPETVIAMLTSTPSTKDIEHIAKRMADDVEALTNCIVYLSVQLSPAAVMPRLVTLDELDTHRDSPYLLYQFAQCQEKLAAYTSIDSEDDPAAQALVREYTSTAILAYHRALLVQPNELHLPSALRLYNFFCQEGEGLEVDVDGSKRILPVFPDLGRNMERYDRDIARGGLGIDGSSISSGSTADANNDTILVDWPLKRWTFLQRLMPRASMVGTIAGAGEVQFVVGNCYESGLVAAHGQILVTPDLFAAIRAWKKAVKYEYAPAMFKLVPYYTEGVENTNAYEHYGGSGGGNGNGSGGGSGHESSIKKNVLLANQYLYRAAEYGIGDAQYAMGVKEEEEALRSASKQAQRITSFSATSMQNLLQALPTEATTEATTAGETAAEDSNTTRPTSLSRTTSASSSSMVNMWALIHHPHFVLAKQWYLRGVQQSGHAHCKAALLRIVQLEQQAAVQQSHQRQSLSRLRSPPLTPSGGTTTASTAPTSSSSSSQSHLLPRTPSASLGDAPTPRTATAAASVVAASVASSSTHEVASHERERGVLVSLVSQPSFDDLPVVEETGEDDEAVGGGGPAVISPASSASASASASRSFHMAAPGINLMADHHPASPNASSQAMVPRVGSSDSAMAAVATAVPIQRASSSESMPSSTQQGVGAAPTATVATIVASPTPAAPTPTGAIGHTVQHPSPHHQQHQSMTHHGSSPAMAQHMVYDPATAAAYPATPPHHHPHHHLPPSPQPTMMYYAASPTSPPPPPHQPQLYPLHPGQMVAGYYYPPVDPHFAAMSQPHPAAYGGHHHSPSAYGGYTPAANASMMSMPPPSSPPPSTTSGTSTSTTTTQQSSNDAHPVPYYVEHYRQHHSQPAPPHHH